MSPPGLAKLAARPISSGLPVVITIGVVFVACRAARALMEEVVTMYVHFFAQELVASSGRRSY